MERENSPTMFMSNTASTSSSWLFSSKNFIIILLIALLVFSSLGINIFIVFGNLFQSIVNFFGPVISQVLSFFGYATGTIIDKSSDVIASTAKTGIDIADGTLHSVGNLLKTASKPGLDITLNQSGIKYKQPIPDTTTNPIQNPITSGKQTWCLVGEYQGKRGCIEVGDSSKCLSGQIFPTQQICLNPTITQNRQP